MAEDAAYNGDSEALREAAQAVLAGIISWGSGPAAPCFDEYDYAVERNRGRWAKVDGAALDRLRAALQGGASDAR